MKKRIEKEILCLQPEDLKKSKMMRKISTRLSESSDEGSNYQSIDDNDTYLASPVKQEKATPFKVAHV